MNKIIFSSVILNYDDFITIESMEATIYLMDIICYCTKGFLHLLLDLTYSYGS